MTRPTFVIALVVIFSIDLMLFLTQQSLDHINPGGAPSFYSYGNSTIGRMDSGGYQLNISSSTVQSQLPQQNIVNEASTIFTDVVSVVFGWIMDIPIIGQMLSILVAPGIFLSQIGAPPEFVFGVAAFWLVITMFTLIAFALGRE